MDAAAPPAIRWTRRGVVAAGALAALLPAHAQRPRDAPGLKAVARGLRFGAAIDAGDLDDPAMRDLFARHCSSLTPRNALKWRTNERRPGEANYEEADRIAAFAVSIGARLYGHTLIWYQMPGWVAAIADAGELRTAMRRRIGGAVARYAGRAWAWDVVNEPLDYDRPEWRPTVFQRLLGEDYIRESLDLAHRADPKATLVINETHLEKAGANHDARRAMLLDLVTRLRAQGAPIHAVGLQAHFRPGFDRLDAPALSTFVRALARIGVGVHITELDGSCRFEHRLPTPDPGIYARTFADTVRAAGVAGTLRGVTTWGLKEKYSKAEAAQGHGCRARMLLYDEALAPRPTLDALTTALRDMR